MEKIDAVGGNQMFGDGNMNFYLQLEKFGINTGALKAREVQRVFWEWVEDWEEEVRKKNNCVWEAQLLAKYKGLVFRDPDTLRTFIFAKTIWSSEGGEKMDGW
jgi:hypothetical protein